MWCELSQSVEAMEFEFDQRKSESNGEKHGINFLEAQQLWSDPDRIEIPARTEDEPRCLVVGKIENKHWSAVITYREGKIRVISVRRAREEEVEIYESRSI
ncbi:BrnT family toxin [Phormidesmis priestleyi]